jgi:hypothetical protein
MSRESHDPVADEPSDAVPSAGADASTELAHTDGHAARAEPPQRVTIVRQRLTTRRSPREEAPGLILMWCLWLLGSWLIIRYQMGMSPLEMIGLGQSFGPRLRTTDLRWLTIAAAAGLSGLWPAVRLSQGGARPGRGALLQPLMDWVGLMLVWQAVLWPMHMLLPWTLAQMVWLNVAVLSWGLLMGLMIALGRASGTAPGRGGAMAGCLALLLAEPAVIALLDWAIPPFSWPWAMRISPFGMLWELTAGQAYLELDPWRGQALSFAVAAVLGWCLLAIGLRLQGRRA